ncbi:sensor histidine kinase [Frigidibacter sp. MR17.24]|uniref:sensor histidine kinase n=1 Tax=Frigidibacter sp. MR17.24 TaxID=3127345 RepID=UPI003012AB94
MATRVLYVDDDPILARLVEKRLSREGYALHHVTDADAAELALAQGGIGAVVLDHYLVRGTGLEILRRLRAQGSEIPAIYVTGSSEATVAVDALKAGADEYVIKSAADDFVALLQRAIGAAIEKAELREARARADAETRAARERAEMLLAEVHHRVANSLAMVTSLLRLQASASGSPEVKSALAEAQNRIAAVAGVHRGLYLGEDVQTILVDAYLDSLLRDFARTLPGNVHMDIAAQPLRISADRAVNLGILVSELATNAAKYAWPDGRDGRLTIRIAETAPGQAKLAVSDDGVGLSPDETKGTGLGRKLVAAMAERLEGTVEIRSDNTGTSVDLSFPI